MKMCFIGVRGWSLLVLREASREAVLDGLHAGAYFQPQDK